MIWETVRLSLRSIRRNVLRSFLTLLGIVIGEFVTAQQGLGYLVMFAASLGETALVLAAIAVLCGIGLLLYGLVLLLEAGFARWYGAPMPAGEFG